MKRRAKPKERPHRSYDIKKDIKPEWLAALGAVCVAWNDIEGALDVALCVVLEVPAPLWLDVSSRIQGIDGKIALIKKAARVHFALPDSVADLVEVSMAAIHEHKTYRDGVIHARILDPDSEIAPSYASKGSEFEAIVSQAALDGPFDRLACLQLEIEDVLLILHHREITIRHVRKLEARGHKKIVKNDPELLSALRSTQEHVAQLQRHQNMRQGLPPLPSFPRELPTPLEKGDTPPIEN
jgi:hypothetical protein